MTNKEAAIWLREHIDATPDGIKQSEAIEMAIDALSERKTGKMILYGHPLTFWHCSECDMIGGEYYQFCPYCGVKIEGEVIIDD